MTVREEHDGNDPDIERLERDSQTFLELFRVRRGELSVVVGDSNVTESEFQSTHVITLYDAVLGNKGATAVVLAARHPDFPDSVRVWGGVLDAIDEDGSNTMIRLLDGREVPLYDLVAFKIAPEWA